jgi:hypothetical protein
MNGEGGSNPLFIGGGGGAPLSDPCDLDHATIGSTAIEPP